MINTKHKPLNKEDILKNISLKNYPRLSEIEILEKTESTNNEAKDIFHKLNKNETSFCFIAEEQTSGRGRFWHLAVWALWPRGGGLCVL